MGTLVAVFAENKGRFFGCHKMQLKIEGLRRVRASRLRYCIGDVFFYAPVEQEGLDLQVDRLCWVRDREYYSLRSLDEAFAQGELQLADVRMGNTYTKRHREESGRFVAVESFVSRELYEGLRKNPEALLQVSKSDFEGLCAEIFARRGFEVDLFRDTKDGGIDFLAVNGEEIDPLVFAVQVKQPEVRRGKPRRSLGRPVVQQIYGAAKAWDLAGAVAISGSTYSEEAAAFVQNKPAEMSVHNAQDVLAWIEKYRWNKDE
jgi:HJR/Mrr/RecB family endonuclease